MSHAYYNENDPYAAQWLRNLIAAGHIAPGYVDERSIADVQTNDLAGYAQAHFFAGVGGWSLALRLAGWPDARPVWTGSCPCQPFSSAGERRGFSDRRHLWPAWFAFIRERRPDVIFGEQVATAPEWVSLVRRNLEHERYRFAGRPIASASIGIPVSGTRFYFVATSGSDGRSRRAQPHEWSQGEQPTSRRHHIVGRSSDAFATARPVVGHDGAMRLIEPGILPLAHGVSQGVGRRGAYGNAIVPQVAAEFIRAADEAIHQNRNNDRTTINPDSGLS